MTDKKKIVLIYVGVAVISVGILGMSLFLSSLRRDQGQQDQSEVATDVGRTNIKDLAVIAEDIALVNEDGKEVKISDLKDKVWLAAQFFADCPKCAERNRDHLLRVYREFKSDKSFAVVCLSVDPEADTPEKLEMMREALDVEKENWLFLKTEQKKLWRYMNEVLFFTDIRPRVDEIEIAQKGRWAHDMGIQVYRGDTLVHKWHTDMEFDVLRAEIEEALKDLQSPPSDQEGSVTINE